MMIATALASFLLVQSTPACRQPDDAMLALRLHTFDQTEAGWRALDVNGCEVVAADAIARYRELNREALAEEYLGNLIWHEGQLRATAGQTDQAIALMVSTHEETTESFAAYVDATVAFLRQDRDALLAARQRLIGLPEPGYYQDQVARFRAAYPDRPAPVWPPNLNVVDGLIACFGRSYSQAYGCDGGAPSQ